ncbi:MAG TPA: FAD-dependent oxidoreductase, partial [Clostridiales bacterium]|nr:FAD-dependent oxidoreductase [Clostridiales bacterium]
MKSYDLIVVGGGFSGTAAAVAPARGGASVLLIERANCLGGAAAGCLVFPYMNYHTTLNGERVALCRGLFTEINERLAAFNDLDGAIDGCRFHDEYLKIVLADMAEEAGVDLLFRTVLTDCTVRD